MFLLFPGVYYEARKSSSNCKYAKPFRFRTICSVYIVFLYGTHFNRIADKFCEISTTMLKYMCHWFCYLLPVPPMIHLKSPGFPTGPFYCFKCGLFLAILSVICSPPHIWLVFLQILWKQAPTMSFFGYTSISDTSLSIRIRQSSRMDISS